ncbi:hypothetical protein KKH23_10230 [Patescibacteria group bacterium]|nr:hypothetical protein [Patescibacteria group bacterium]
MDFKVTGNKLTIAVTLEKGTLSSSGKNLVVATTSGFVPVEGSDLKVNLNVIKPKS